MLEHRPDLCAALYEDLWRSRFGEEDATNKSAYPLPVWGVRRQVHQPLFAHLYRSPNIRALFEATYFVGLRNAGMPEE